MRVLKVLLVISIVVSAIAIGCNYFWKQSIGEKTYSDIEQFSKEADKGL